MTYYTLEYTGTGLVVQPIWLPLLPENAIAGTPPVLAAYDAAPTVPEMSVVEPVLPPTFGPATTRAGLPLKNFGASVERPYLTEVTG
jgi:hypothetical protein